MNKSGGSVTLESPTVFIKEQNVIEYTKEATRMTATVTTREARRHNFAQICGLETARGLPWKFARCFGEVSPYFVLGRENDRRDIGHVCGNSSSIVD